MTKKNRAIHAVVTGSSGGIGAAVVRKFLSRGHVVTGIDVRGPQETEPEAGHASFIFKQCDLSDSAAVHQLVSTLGEASPTPNVLINNAGISMHVDGRRPGYDEISDDDLRHVLDVNLVAPFILCRGLVPAMTDAGWGRVVNMSSQAGRTAAYGAGCDYSIAKTGLLGLTRTLAYEVARQGVTVNAIAPGRIATPMLGSLETELNKRLLDTVPMGRYGTPGEVADLVGFLASDESRYITGTVTDINGGRFMA